MALNQFTDRLVEHPGRYTLTDTEGTVMGTYDLTRAEGTVTEEGTPLNAANMNTIIGGVNELDEKTTGCIVIETYTLSGMQATITPGDNTVYINYDTIPSSLFEDDPFEAVGVIGIGTSGTGSSMLRIRAFGVSSGNRAYIKLRSEASADITPTIAVTVLWVRSRFVR